MKFNFYFCGRICYVTFKRMFKVMSFKHFARVNKEERNQFSGALWQDLRSRTNLVGPLLLHRKGQRETTLTRLPPRLQRPVLPKVSSHENRTGSTTRPWILVFKTLVSKLITWKTRKPHSLNLNIKDSVVSFESQRWTHFGNGSRDCFSSLLRNERTTSECGPASAWPIMSFLLASMIINRCAMNHYLEGAPLQTHGWPLEGAKHQNDSQEFPGRIHCFEERSLQPRPSCVWSEWVVPSIITSTSNTCPHESARC